MKHRNYDETIKLLMLGESGKLVTKDIVKLFKVLEKVVSFLVLSMINFLQVSLLHWGNCFYFFSLTYSTELNINTKQFLLMKRKFCFKFGTQQV